MISHTSSYFKFHLNRGAESVFYGKNICRSENDLKYSFAFSRGGERKKISMFSLRTSSSTFPGSSSVSASFHEGMLRVLLRLLRRLPIDISLPPHRGRADFPPSVPNFRFCASFLPSVLHFYVSSPVPIIKSTFYVQLGPS